MVKIIESIAKNMRSILGLTVTLGSYAYLFVLLYVTVPAQNATIMNVSAGIVLAALTGVVGYYFGSSKDKSDQDKATIAKDAADPNVVK